MDTVQRKCLFDGCGYEFQSEVNDLQLSCPKCSAATYKLTTKDRYRASNCPNTEDCYLYDQYRPECENLTFTPRCLVSVHEKLHLQELRLNTFLEQKK
jgi:hypothetical protein